MFSVGLTGGIGSGKSTVANVFKKLGATIIDADEIAYQITKPNAYALEAIIEHFGKTILQADGSLDRKTLRTIIFNDPRDRKWLEDHLHPIIREAMKGKIAKAVSVYCLLVIPLLAESKAKNFDYLNRICVIDVPEALQIKRVIDRDHASKTEVKAILESQASNEERLKLADDMIHNDGDLETLQDQVMELNKKYLTMAEKLF